MPRRSAGADGEISLEEACDGYEWCAAGINM